MSQRKTARSIRNAELRTKARGDIERKRAEQRAIQARGGHRQPVSNEAEQAAPESGVDYLESLVDAQADDLDRAINNPDAMQDEEQEPGIIEKIGKEAVDSMSGGSNEPEAGG